MAPSARDCRSGAAVCGRWGATPGTGRRGLGLHVQQPPQLLTRERRIPIQLAGLEVHQPQAVLGHQLRARCRLRLGELTAEHHQRLAG